MATIFLLLLLLGQDMISCDQKTLRRDHRGRHFVLAFPDSGTDDNTNLLVITSENANDVTVYVIIPNADPLNYSIDAGSSKHIYLPYQTTVVSNMAVDNKGIQIIASDPVSVYGYIYRYDSMGGFLVLPVEVLSTEYIAVTYYPHNRIGGHVVVVAAEDETKVNITIKTRVSTICNNSHVPDGHPLTATLQSLQVVRIFCEDDITGTLIKSSKPVAVLSGNPLAQVPQNMEHPDNVIEMMLPTYAFGFKYALPPDFGRACGTIYRVVAQLDKTEVVESDGTRHSLNEREFLDLAYPHNEYRCIQSNKPTLVVQFGKGESADVSNFEGDPFMTIIPPMDRYASSYKLDLYSMGSTPGHSVVPYVTVLVNKSISSGLKFMQPVVFQDVPECDVVIASKTSVQGQLDLVHRDGFAFGITVHGLTTWKAYGYLAGIVLEDYSGVDECAPLPCNGKGLCYESGKTFRCYCARRGEGTQCDNDNITEASELSTSPTPSTSGPSTDSTTADSPEATTVFTTETNGVTTERDAFTQTAASVSTSTEKRGLKRIKAEKTGSTIVLRDLETTAASELEPVAATTTESDPTTAEIKVMTKPDVTLPEVKIPVSKSTKSNPCNCTCKNVTYEEVEEKAKDIKRELTVNPVVLSKSKRKFVSVQDDRLSASSIGCLGGAFLTLVFGSICLVDLSTVLSRWLASARDKTRAHEASLRDTSIHRKHIIHVKTEADVLHVDTTRLEL